MKRIVIIMIFGLLLCSKANAQQGQKGQKERIKAYRTAYITEKLDLSVQEAEKFWPVYNEYDKKLFSLNVEKSRREKHRIKELGGPENLSDKEATEIVFNMLGNEKEASITREKMYQELSKILSPTKLLTLYQAERNFNKRLLSEYRKRKNQ